MHPSRKDLQSFASLLRQTGLSIQDILQTRFKDVGKICTYFITLFTLRALHLVIGEVEQVCTLYLDEDEDYDLFVDVVLILE